MGLEALRRIQIGKESARGTEVAADGTLIGAVSLTPNIAYHRPMDERNSLAEFRRSIATAHMSALQYTGDLTYEQVCYFLAMTLEGGESGADIASATTAKDWTFLPSLTSRNNQDAFTMEYGDDLTQWTSPFTMANSMDIGIRLGEVASLSADLFSRYALRKAQTASVVESEPREVVSDSARFYVDDTWGSVGTSELDSELAGGSIRLVSGLRPLRLADGLIAGRSEFSTVSEQKRTHSMDLDILATADGMSEIYDAWESNSFKAIRVSFNLDSASNTIEAGFSHELEVDMYGKFTSDPGLFSAHEGENMFRMTFQSHDNGASTPRDLRVRVRNSIATI